MTVKKAQPCGCIEPIYQGKKARRECEHHNLFLGTPLPRVGKKRQEEIDSGERPSSDKGLKRTRRRESKAERAARDHFNVTVKDRGCWFRDSRPCEKCNGRGWYMDVEHDVGSLCEPRTCNLCKGDGMHRCFGELDAHHLVPKDFLRRNFQAVLPEDQFVAILFNPKLGAPLCRKAHDRLEAGFDRIYWEDLTDEAVEYFGSLPDFVLLRLEEESPKRKPIERSTR